MRKKRGESKSCGRSKKTERASDVIVKHREQLCFVSRKASAQI